MPRKHYNDVIDMDEMLGGRSDLLGSRKFLRRLSRARHQAAEKSIKYAKAAKRGGATQSRNIGKAKESLIRTRRVKTLEHLAAGNLPLRQSGLLNRSAGALQRELMTKKNLLLRAKLRKR